MTEAIIALVVLFVLALLGCFVREKPRDGTSLTWTHTRGAEAWYPVEPPQ